MALTAGSIAFVGFNGDGNDNLAFVALVDIPANTVINFTDKEWTGSGFNSGEGTWSWTATTAVAAGTIIRIDSVGGSPTTNTGSVSGSSGLSNDAEIVYAYVGSASSPTFLAAIGNNGPSIEGATLTGTGLTAGVNAIFFTGNGSDGIDIMAYNGSRTGAASFASYLASINNTANWITQNTGSDDSNGCGACRPEHRLHVGRNGRHRGRQRHEGLHVYGKPNRRDHRRGELLRHVRGRHHQCGRLRRHTAGFDVQRHDRSRRQFGHRHHHDRRRHGRRARRELHPYADLRDQCERHDDARHRNRDRHHQQR
jgi:hypothetical protein